MRYDFHAEPCGPFVRALLRAHLVEGGVFPSAAMQWLATSILEAAGYLSERDPKHAELLESAGHHMRRLAERQRERDDAHYADILPEAADSTD